MKALNMSGNAHMARCVRSTVMRKTPKTVAPIIHEVTAIPRQGTFATTSTPVVSVIATRAVTTPAMHMIGAHSTNGMS
ncbi:hypothetical protein TELCIR_06372 [Teladorsagia circumcincta]|uniref:Uncharacterized protein n=1 Tax=Teladorsagia circumcincta TaxID=45464 RepID=A0A2G9UNB9_TELCI|nr:hypothetical protein TELCIR_06372 [Teladorsagia circumcincta]